jgi:hypothetical protein
VTRKEANLRAVLDAAIVSVTGAVGEDGLVVVVAVQAAGGFWMRSAINRDAGEDGPPGEVLTWNVRRAIESYLSRCPNVARGSPGSGRPS